MRQIKFRAWQKQESLHRSRGMYDVISIDSYGEHHDGYTGEVLFRDQLSTEYLEDVVLMQYTGLKDKNGREIYEGDIVNYFDDEGEAPDPNIIAKVEFGRGYYSVTSNDFEYEPLFIWACRCKVIGNIYENPELLIEQAA